MLAVAAQRAAVALDSLACWPTNVRLAFAVLALGLVLLFGLADRVLGVPAREFMRQVVTVDQEGGAQQAQVPEIVIVVLAAGIVDVAQPRTFLLDRLERQQWCLPHHDAVVQPMLDRQLLERIRDLDWFRAL